MEENEGEGSEHGQENGNDQKLKKSDSNEAAQQERRLSRAR